MSKKQNKQQLITRAVWAKIRYYQMIDDMPDAVLAEYLGVCPRTLLNYDKNASSLTLGQLAAYLDYTDRKMNDLVPADIVGL